LEVTFGQPLWTYEITIYLSSDVVRNTWSVDANVTAVNYYVFFLFFILNIDPANMCFIAIVLVMLS